jgi:CBS-domain-containing membrane protein
MKVDSIMTADVVSVATNTTVRAIARLLVDHDIDGVPVVDSGGRVAGMVTESDLIVRNANLHFPRFLQIMEARIFLENPKHFDEEVRKMLGTTAADVMSSPAIVVEPGDDIERAATLMVEKRVHTLPVVQSGKLVGIISRSDLVKLMADDAQTD